MAILVTGASGFVGSSLIETLLNKGEKVIGIGLQYPGFINADFLKHDNFVFIHSDMLSVDVNQLKNHNIACIYNLASLQPASGINNFEKMYNGNVSLTQKVISWAKFLRIEAVIHISTSAVFGDGQTSVLNERTLVNPTSYYGLSKYVSERLLEVELSDTGIKTTIIRFPSIFGKNHLGGIIHTLYSLAVTNRQIELYSNGTRHRNIIYIDSVIELLYQVFKNQKVSGKYDVFMAGSSDSKKLVEIAEQIIQLIQSSSEIMLVDKHSPTDSDVFIDSSKVIKRMGFKPWSIDEGLARYVEVMKNENL